ncbi:glutaminyl-peptide cyclotransferase-like isoform X1 [Tubulanus polymorphus]|uniref:glutaminyl-peptide cyclotransferase-like isoform X1 n=1 Tax=Tubulanus polymorphus TaxID=672921 RepID=UPI003DA5AAC8
MNEKAFVYLILIVSALNQACFSAQKWHEKRERHRSKRVPARKISRLLSQINQKDFDTELRPFLKVRYPGSRGHDEVKQHIINEMEYNLRWTVERDTFVATTPKDNYDTDVMINRTFTNIVATFNPNARRYLVLACHYDSKLFRGYDFIGATDSAVPCAMMIYIAKLLNRSLSDHSQAAVDETTSTCASVKLLMLVWAGKIPQQSVPKDEQTDDLTLQLMFFDGEEAFGPWTETDSIYGSRHLANQYAQLSHPNDPTKKRIHGIDVLVLLDLIGAKNPTFYNWFDVDVSKNNFNMLHTIESRLRNESLLKVRHKYFENWQPAGSGIEDDHKPFLLKGVPIVHLIAFPFPTVWHKLDDVESELDKTSIEDLNKIVTVYVTEYLHLLL